MISELSYNTIACVLESWEQARRTKDFENEVGVGTNDGEQSFDAGRTDKNQDKHIEPDPSKPIHDGDILPGQGKRTYAEIVKGKQGLRS